MRVGAIYCAQRYMDYLENSLLSIATAVDTILIGVNRRQKIDRNSLSHVKTLPSFGQKIQIVEGDWVGAVESQNDLLRILVAQGLSHALLVEPQEVYSARELRQILHFACAHPEVGQFQAEFQVYWKSLAYRVEPPDCEKQVIISRINSGTRFVASRQTNEAPLLAIPAEFGCAHSFDFASPFPIVLERVDSGLSVLSQQKWKQETWDGWNGNRSLRNLHPLTPKRFRGAARINFLSLPEALSRHPYLKEEIIGEEPRRKPNFSLIFSPQSELNSVQRFVGNLIDTGPDDFELIGCVSEQRADVISFLNSKPGAKVVVLKEITNSWAALSEATQIAEGKYYVFLNDCLAFEGDWLEGFLAAFAERDHGIVYLPKILSSDFFTVDAQTNPTVLPKPASRQQAFEKCRGQRYGLRSVVNGLTQLEDQLCWACSRETWDDIQRAKILDAHSVKLEYQQLEDTLVFYLGYQTKISNSQSSIDNQQPTVGLPVSIVIPVYNNLNFTKACLESVFQHTTPGSYEIIVVDNGSTDGTKAYMETLQSKIRYIRNHRNLFFAKGCNRGGWAARGENILFLNNDTVVKPGWLEEMMKVLSKDPKIGIVGNKQLFPNSNPAMANRVWHAGVVITQERNPWHVFYGFDSSHPLVNQERDYPFVTGCCLLIRKQVFEELQGFDPHFQNGYEDTDLCLRARDLGYRIVYAPRSELVHHVSSSESRFDRDFNNYQKFMEKWADRVTPNEVEVYREAGLIPSSENRPAIRIGYISTFNQKCALADYARHLLREYPTNSYLVLSEFCSSAELCSADSFNVVRAWDRNMPWLYPLLRLALNLDFDIIHFNFDFNLFTGGLMEWLKVARQYGKKVVITFHHTSVNAPQIKELCALVSAVIVHSPESRLELILNGCDASKVHVIFPGVPPLSNLSREAIRETLNIPLGEKVIASPGFIAPHKRILEVIQALSEIRPELKVTYLVLGEIHPHQPEMQEYLEKCKAAVSQHQLQRQVLFFEDYLEEEELKNYLSCADAIVLPYDTGQYAWSSAAALALSTGQAVITSSDPMFSALGDAVFRFNGGISLSQAIRSVLTNPFLSDQLKANARAYTQANPWEKAAEQHWKLYQQVKEEEDEPGVYELARYLAHRSETLSTETAEQIYLGIKNHLRGKVLELGAHSSELTRFIRPELSVTPSSELCRLAKSLQMKTRFLTIGEFQGVQLSPGQFETILLHVTQGIDAWASQILMNLPNNSRLLVLLDINRVNTSDVEKKLRSMIGHHLIVQMNLDSSFRLLEINSHSSAGSLEVCVSAERATKDDEDRQSHRLHPQIAELGNLESIPLLWSAPFYEHSNLGESARSMALAISCQGLDIKLADSSATCSGTDAKTFLRLDHLQRRVLGYPFVHVEQRSPYTWARQSEFRWNVARCLLANDCLPEELKRQLQTMDAVWVPTRFHYEACLSSGLMEDRLFLLPETLDFPLLQKTLEPLPLQEKRGFNFLSTLSWSSLEGWEVLVQAFMEEFKQSEDVTLILKLEHPSASSSESSLDRLSAFIRSQLRKDPASVHNILVIRQELNPEQLIRLYLACQTYVSPIRVAHCSRSILTAMALGIPVIATPWGSHRDLIKPENSSLLNYSLTNVPSKMRQKNPPYVGSRWAEPSKEHLRELMRQVSTHFQLAKAKATQAKEEVYECYSWGRIARMVRNQLIEIHEKLHRRPQIAVSNSSSQPHVCWEGPQLINHSLARVNRELEEALIKTNQVELSILPSGPDNFADGLNPKIKNITLHYGRQSSHPIDIHVRHQWPPNWTPPAEGRWVLIQPWEFGALPVQWVEKVNSLVDEVWAPSNFVRQLYIQSGVDPRRIQVIPNGVDTEFFRPGLKPYKIPSSKTFKFLFLGGTISRKGIDLLLQAYQNSFRAEDDVLLVIKDMGAKGVYRGQGAAEKIQEFQKGLRSPEIYYIDWDLTDSEVARLYNACDCLVHPYRGEGFGLPVLEAMSCGLPVIVTAGGATDDFVDDFTGYRIPSRRQVFGNREISGLKTTGDLWMLEPDLQALSDRLIQVFQRRQEARAVGAKARKRVSGQWSWQHGARLALERIETLRKEPILRFQEKVDTVVLFDPDPKEEIPLDALNMTVRSLWQNSYARLKIFLRVNSGSSAFHDLSQENTSLQTVLGENLSSVLDKIRFQVQSPYLTIISAPLLFSKQWFSQISDIAGQIGVEPKIITPSVDFKGAEHYVKYEANGDDFSFQRFARALWRTERGQYREMTTLPKGCAVLSWDCLRLIPENSPNWQEWIMALRREGIKCYWALDTFVKFI